MTETKKNKKSKHTFKFSNRKYDSRKLSAEEVVCVKWGLSLIQKYENGNIPPLLNYALMRLTSALTDTDDFFIRFFWQKKRVRVRNRVCTSGDDARPKKPIIVNNVPVS